MSTREVSVRVGAKRKNDLRAAAGLIWNGRGPGGVEKPEGDGDEGE